MLQAALDLALLGHLVGAAGYVALAVYLLVRRPSAGKSDRSQVLALAAVVASAAWGLASAFDQASAYTGSSFLAAGGDLARYGCWLGFLLTLLPQGASSSTADPAGSSQKGLLLVTVGIVLVAAALLGYRVTGGLYEPAAFRPYLLVQLALPLIGLLLVEQVFRNLAEDKRWHAKPVCVGLGGVFAFDVYLFAEAALLGQLDEDLLAVRPLAQAFVIPLLFLASRRKVNWIQSMQVSRRAVFYSATLLLAGAYLTFLAAIGYYVRYFGGNWGRALQLGLLFVGMLSLVMLVLSASLRAKVRVFVGKHFFSYRYDYREEWLAFTAMLSSNSSPQEVGLLVIRALANIVECPAGSLWTKTDDKGDYRQVATWNQPETTTGLPNDSRLVSFLRERAWIVDLDQSRLDPQVHPGLELPAWLVTDARHCAAIPLNAGDTLLGFVVLARPRTPVDLNWEARDLLKTASRQAAGYLAQMHATEALLESRKFDAFNRMSAFVVHDLKNIVTQLSLMMSNARRLRDNPEFQEDMILTVESSLDKMRRLMLQLREGVAPPGGARGVELAPLVTKLEALARRIGRSLEVQVVEPLATRGHDERLERVLGHLVQNALDATPSSGRVWISVSRFSGQVRVEIGDTGQGMTDEFIRTRLFKPFSSTKGSGMGIGTYESAQYIRELGGSIDVVSAVGQGTTLSVLLPVFEASRGSDLGLTTAT